MPLTVAVPLIVALAALLGLPLVLLRTRLVTLEQGVEEAWDELDAQLRRRCDLVPTLVEAVYAYTGSARGIYDMVKQACTDAVEARGAGRRQQAAAEDQLNAALRSLFAASAARPQMWSSERMRHMRRDMNLVEDRIHFARRLYNRRVRDYNRALEGFPAILLGGILRARPAPYFELHEIAASEASAVAAGT